MICKVYSRFFAAEINPSAITVKNCFRLARHEARVDRQLSSRADATVLSGYGGERWMAGGGL